MRTLSLILTILLLASVSGCAARAGQVPLMRYRSQSVAVMSTRANLMRAVWRHATLRGWQIVRFDERLGTIEALTPTDDRDGVQTRTRWLFKANDGELIVTLRLELAAGASADFEASEDVCDSYGYSQERAQLAHVKSML